MFTTYPIRYCRGKAAMLLAVVLMVGLASPVSVYGGKKKKADPPAPEQSSGPMVDLSKIDISKLVWPQPPSIPRVRYIAYFAGMKIDHTPAASKPKPKQSWMDRVAGAKPQDEKSMLKDFPFQLLGPFGMAVDSRASFMWPTSGWGQSSSSTRKPGM